MQKTSKTEAEWRAELTPEEFAVTRKRGTERAFTGRYWDNHAAGLYACACCGNTLFRSNEKFEPGQDVTVLVRPESIRIGDQGGVSAPMSWTGKIVQAIFRGQRTSIAVDTGGTRINVEAPAILGLKVNDQVKVTVPPGGAWAIRA